MHSKRKKNIAFSQNKGFKEHISLARAIILIHKKLIGLRFFLYKFR